MEIIKTYTLTDQGFEQLRAEWTARTGQETSSSKADWTKEIWKVEESMGEVGEGRLEVPHYDARSGHTETIRLGEEWFSVSEEEVVDE